MAVVGDIKFVVATHESLVMEENTFVIGCDFTGDHQIVGRKYLWYLERRCALKGQGFTGKKKWNCTGNVAGQEPTAQTAEVFWKFLA